MSNPFRSKRFHAYAAIFWTFAIIPTLIWWKESILWVAFMSLWANVASHMAALAAEDANPNTD